MPVTLRPALLAALAAPLLPALPLGLPGGAQGAPHRGSAPEEGRAPAGTRGAPAVRLTPGPLAERVAALDWEAVGGTLAPRVLPVWEEAAWSEPEPWRRWARLVRRAAAGGDGARTALAVLASEQGRWDDAWSHLGRIDDDAALARVLPAVAAGVPPELAPRDGLGAPLPDGVTLSPALPPDTVDPRDPMLRLERTLEVTGLRVGGAVVDLRVALEGDGVQVDLTHVSGEPCTVRVRVPEPEGFEIRVEYLDWARLEDVGAAREVALRPGDEPHKLWGRFLRFPRPWPTQLPERTPRQVRAAGVVLVTPPGGGGEALLSGFAAALRDELGVPARLVPDGASVPPGPAPVRLHFTLPGERLEKLAAVQGLVERHAGALGP